MELAVGRGPDEDQTAGGYDSAPVGGGRPRLFHAQLVQLFKSTKRNLPNNCAGIDVNSDQT